MAGKLCSAAHSLAVHLREHFEIEDQPAPPSGGATARTLGLLLVKWNALGRALPPAAGVTGGGTAQLLLCDALDRLRQVHGEIGRLFGFDQLRQRGDSIEFSGKYPVVPLAVVNALEWAADRLSGKQAEPPVVEDQDVDDEPITPAKLADRLRIPQDDKRVRNTLNKRLQRWRDENPGGGWVEVTDPKPRQPRYLYPLRTVLPIVEDLKPSG